MAVIKKFHIYPLGFQVFFFLAFCYVIGTLVFWNDFEALNTGMLILWHIWWPLIPLLILFSGRLWCSVCPFSSTANAINRLFPYHFFDGAAIVRHGMNSGLMVFVAIMAVDAIYAVKFNRQYTLIFFMVFFCILILMAVLFDYKTYCNTVCPFGLISRIYTRFAFLRIKGKDGVCGRCKRGPWFQSSRLGEMKLKGRGTARSDWKGQLECLKKCPANSMGVQYANPLVENPAFEGLKPADALAPSMMIVIFTAYVFLKSNYFVNVYKILHSSFSVSLDVFIFAVILVIIGVSILMNLVIMRVSTGFLEIEKTVVYRCFYCITPLLIFFNIALVLKDLSGITALGHLYPMLAFLESVFPSESPLHTLAYFLTFLGVVLSALSFLYLVKVPTGLSKKISLACTGVFGVILGYNAFFALATINYFEYFG